MAIDKRECFLTTAKYQICCEHAICSSDKNEEEL